MISNAIQQWVYKFLTLQLPQQRSLLYLRVVVVGFEQVFNIAHNNKL